MFVMAREIYNSPESRSLSFNISLTRSIKIYHVHFPVFSSESYLQLEMEEISQDKSIENCTDKTE